MANPPSQHHRGQMDIHAQQSTFKAVMAGTKWASLVVAVGVLFFTLLFCTEAGFMSALISAIVLAVLGGVFLRPRPAAPAH